MGVEAMGIGGGDGIDGGGGGGDQAVGGALGGGTQALLDLGEGQLDRVEVGRVSRQKQQAAPTASMAVRASSRLCALRLSRMTTCPAAGLGRGRARRKREGRPVDRPRDRDGRTDARRGQGGQERHVGTVVAGVRPTARSPRGARARRRVSAVWVLVSSTKTRSAGLSVAASSRQAARAASSRSAAMSDFF